MVKREVTGLTRKLEAIRKRVGEDRDRLREVIGEAQELLDSCEEAELALERAVDALSQLA